MDGVDLMRFRSDRGYDSTRAPVINNPAEVIYRVDADGSLTFVNDAWDAFARLNDTPELCGPAVLGRRVADAIADPATCEVFERIRRRAAEGAQVELTFRCDSPMLRRLMSLTVVAAGREVEFRSRVVGVAMRLVVRLLEPGRPRSAAFLSLCGWCNRGRIGERWADIEEVVSELTLFESDVPQLTHGMCPDCLSRVTSELSA
jgi:hypothetical protein